MKQSGFGNFFRFFGGLRFVDDFEDGSELFWTGQDFDEVFLVSPEDSQGQP